MSFRDWLSIRQPTVRPPSPPHSPRPNTAPQFRGAHRDGSFHRLASPERGLRWPRWDGRCDGPSVPFTFSGLRVQFTHDSQCLYRKSFVEFVKINVFVFQPVFSQIFRTAPTGHHYPLGIDSAGGLSMAIRTIGCAKLSRSRRWLPPPPRHHHLRRERYRRSRSHPS